jgi:hypothetical protein
MSNYLGSPWSRVAPGCCQLLTITITITGLQKGMIALHLTSKLLLTGSSFPEYSILLPHSSLSPFHLLLTPLAYSGICRAQTAPLSFMDVKGTNRSEGK